VAIFKEIYDADVSVTLISRVTDAVIESFFKTLKAEVTYQFLKPIRSVG